MFSVTPIMAEGQVDDDPLHDLHPHEIWILWIFYLCGHLKILVYAALFDNEGAFHYCIVAVCQTIRNYPGIF
jgi:hypothetical protein